MVGCAEGVWLRLLQSRQEAGPQSLTPADTSAGRCIIALLPNCLGDLPTEELPEQNACEEALKLVAVFVAWFHARTLRGPEMRAAWECVCGGKCRVAESRAFSLFSKEEEGKGSHPEEEKPRAGLSSSQMDPRPPTQQDLERRLSLDRH